MATPTPNLSPDSVATPLCPICRTVPLTGKQLVCSPKCRIQRSMGRRMAKQTERDARLRVLLREVLTGQNPEHVRQRVGEALALLSP